LAPASLQLRSELKFAISHTVNHVVNSALQPFATISQHQPGVLSAQTNRPKKVISFLQIFRFSLGYKVQKIHLLNNTIISLSIDLKNYKNFKTIT